MNNDASEQVLDWLRNRYFGKYRGVLTGNDDPDSRGRVKVRVPAVLGELEVWAMPCVPYAGDGVGFYALPGPGAGVWVEFEAGDASFPIWTGCFWASGELPDRSDAQIKVLKTESHTLRFDDGGDEILIENSSNSKITIAADIVTESGGATHSVGSNGVIAEKGPNKTEVTDTSVRVNNGALEVM